MQGPEESPEKSSGSRRSKGTDDDQSNEPESNHAVQEDHTPEARQAPRNPREEEEDIEILLVSLFPLFSEVGLLVCYDSGPSGLL